MAMNNLIFQAMFWYRDTLATMIFHSATFDFFEHMQKWLDMVIFSSLAILLKVANCDMFLGYSQVTF